MSVIRQKGDCQNGCFKICVSGGKKCSFFGKFGVLSFLETLVLRFARLLYYWRILMQIHFYLGQLEWNKKYWANLAIMYIPKSLLRGIPMLNNFLKNENTLKFLGKIDQAVANNIWIMILYSNDREMT